MRERERETRRVVEWKLENLIESGGEVYGFFIWEVWCRERGGGGGEIAYSKMFNLLPF